MMFEISNRKDYPITVDLNGKNLPEDVLLMGAKARTKKDLTPTQVELLNKNKSIILRSFKKL